MVVRGQAEILLYGPNKPMFIQDNSFGFSKANIRRSVETIYNAVSIIELAADKGAPKILMPVAARKQLFKLPDNLTPKIAVAYCADAKDALLKRLLIKFFKTLPMGKLAGLFAVEILFEIEVINWRIGIK